MSDPNDVWQNDSAPANDNYAARETSPRRDDAPRSPRRDRSRSPVRNGGGGGEGGRGGRDDRDSRDNRGRVPEGESTNQGNNLHVSGLAKVVDIRMLEDVFGKIGKVDKAEIMSDPHTQESRGFGFVKMILPEDAQAAIDQLNGTDLEGKTLSIQHARRGRARTPTPGRYHGARMDGPPRYGGYQDRPYQPRSYDSRYSDRGPPRYDDRRFDDRRDDRRYDDRRDDRRDYGRGGGDRYDDRGDRGGGGGGGGDRDYYRRSGGDRERGGYERREERPRYDERPRY